MIRKEAMTTDEILEAEARYILQTYKRAPVVFMRGEGVHLYDQAGKRYLDFASGIAVLALGHSHPVWLDAVVNQIGLLTHVSNLFHTVPHIELARALVENSFADRVFFSNSGAEANEAAFKFARRWAGRRQGEGKTEVVAFEGGFHGRTMGALSLTHKSKYRQPFQPLIPGVSFAPFNDLEAAGQVINDRTCAVFVEPIQGEGGVHAADPAFIQGLRQLCDQHGALLVFDEVQCGLGRTGWLWAHQAYGVTPDLMTVAKPLAGGLPIGATLMTEAVAAEVSAGDHGSTFGAGPLVCSAALAVFNQINQPALLSEVAAKGEALRLGLHALPTNSIVEVRGAGLLLGVEFKFPVEPIIRAALKRGLVVINAGENVMRICPPLTIGYSEIEAGLEILSGCLTAIEQAG